MDYLTKNITYSKDGATFTCPHCGDSDTYQIGQLDTTKWARGRHNQFYCKTCRSIPLYEAVFYAPIGGEPKDEISELLEMI